MALPPILSNMPFLKVFKTDKAQTGAGQNTEKMAADNPQDVVNISSAASARLNGTKVLSLENEEELRTVLGETRHILASTDQVLGLKKNFR